MSSQQTAQALVAVYPFCPDMLTALNMLAELEGEPPAPALLGMQLEELAQLQTQSYAQLSTRARKRAAASQILDLY